MKLVLDSTDQSLMQNLIVSIDDCKTVESYIETYMQIMSKLLKSESYVCYLFNSQCVNKDKIFFNTPPKNSKANFGIQDKQQLLITNKYAPASSYPNLIQYAMKNKGILSLFGKSTKLTKHGDSFYRPFWFKDRNIGFYGCISPEGGNAFIRNFQILNIMEPILYNGIQQILFKEKIRYQDHCHRSNNRFAIIYQYPGGILEIPTNTNHALICEALQLEELNAKVIQGHPLFDKLTSSGIFSINAYIPRSIQVQRDNSLYTLTIQFNDSIQRHRSSFLTAICIEKVKKMYPGYSFVQQHLLTRREKEVVYCVIEGMSNKQISKTMFISESTVKKHLSNIFVKLGCRSRTQLALSLK